jgi:type II secretory pathway pseudopilin PulG
MSEPSFYENHRKALGFSLIEVVLAIGIFLITVLALVGLLGPTLQSVDEVEKTDEIASVVNTVNAFLQNSPEIAGTTGDSKFDLIYNAVAKENHATVFVFREFIGDTENVRLVVGFQEAESLAGDSKLGGGAEIDDDRFDDSAGTIYRVILTPSSVIPTPTATPAVYRSVDRNSETGTYTLNAVLADYLEGYFAMEVRIFAEDPGPTFISDKDLDEFNEVEPLFTYNTAVVR